MFNVMKGHDIEYRPTRPVKGLKAMRRLNYLQIFYLQIYDVFFIVIKMLNAEC